MQVELSRKEVRAQISRRRSIEACVEDSFPNDSRVTWSEEALLLEEFEPDEVLVVCGRYMAGEIPHLTVKPLKGGSEVSKPTGWFQKV